MNPKISLITISYNSSQTISKTIKSIRDQSFKDFEHIVIDGNSTDNTLSIIKKYNLSKTIISEPDEGIYDAFNKGINYSKGEIIGFLNSDDEFFDKDSLSIINSEFNNNVDCVFGDLIYTNSKEKIVRVWKGSNYKKGLFKKGWMPAHPTFFCKKSIYNRFGLYDKSFKIAGDFELMLRFICIHGIRSKYIPKKIVNMKAGGISNKSFFNKLTILKEEFRAFKKNQIKINRLFYILHKIKKIKEFNL